MQPAHVDISVLSESATSTHRSTRGHLGLIGTAERSRVRGEARGVRRHSRFLECRPGASKSVTESSPGEVVYDPTSPRGVAIGPIGGAVDPLQRLLGKELLGLEIEAIAVVGDLGAALSKPDAYRAVFHTLGETGLPAFWIPDRFTRRSRRTCASRTPWRSRSRGSAGPPRSQRAGVRGAGEAAAEERVCSSLVVCPGRSFGIGPVIDIHSGSVEVRESAGVTAERTA